MKITNELRKKFIALKFEKKVLPDLTETEKNKIINKIKICHTTKTTKE